MQGQRHGLKGQLGGSGAPAWEFKSPARDFKRPARDFEMPTRWSRRLAKGSGRPAMALGDLPLFWEALRAAAII